jgi:TfoX/Sxy family transcriptional regulator of competence genes
MSYNEFLADRIRSQLVSNHIFFKEKIMFGGICFMVDDKMLLGVIRDNLMVRIDPLKQNDYLLAESGCRIMDFTKHPMKGYLYVDPEGTDMEEDLRKWVRRCLEFNPKAKSSKRKR